MWGAWARWDWGLRYPFSPGGTRASTLRGRWEGHVSLTVCVFLQGAFSAFCCVRDARGRARARRPLWLQDMYRPLNATRKKNMAQKLHDKESSDEEEVLHAGAG
uniref:Uncharacterized protein n=2 Tax=Sus scrofa TaxID=9823 RepID=A0A4X1TN33_PIG